MAPARQKGSGSQARTLATSKFNQRGNGRAVNVTPRNSKLEVQVRAFRRALFLRQDTLPHFVSLHLVGTGNILLRGGGGGGGAFHSEESTETFAAATETGMGSGLMDYLAQMQNLHFLFYSKLILCQIAAGRVRATHHNEKVKQEINNVSTMQDIFPDNELISFVTKRLVAL